MTQPIDMPQELIDLSRKAVNGEMLEHFLKQWIEDKGITIYNVNQAGWGYFAQFNPNGLGKGRAGNQFDVDNRVMFNTFYEIAMACLDYIYQHKG